PQRDYRILEEQLGEDYLVESLDLSSGDVPDRVDVLVVGKVGSLSDHERFALDQYLMRGGAVVALAGSWQVDLSQRTLAVVPLDGALAELVEEWGVTVRGGMVLDPENAPFPVPVQEQRGPFMVERIELIPYPFFPDIRRDGTHESHPAVTGLPNVTVPWASALELAELPEGVQSEVLLATSPDSWIDTSGNIEPDFTTWPDNGFGASAETERGSHAVAVVLTGTLPSAFADEASPTWNPQVDGSGDAQADLTGRTLTQAVPEARLAVVGSAEVTSDLVMSLAGQVSGEVHRSNLQLLQNLVDWSMEDTDLLEIRSAGEGVRTLDPLTDEERNSWEIATYVAVLLLLGLVVMLGRRPGPGAIAGSPETRDVAGSAA
ncbi:MAG: Gldg family protein, partial [Myxococcota bacterium]|nr:Gldg family protein [Myxococcota bacterium]